MMERKCETASDARSVEDRDTARRLRSRRGIRSVPIRIRASTGPGPPARPTGPTARSTEGPAGGGARCATGGAGGGGGGRRGRRPPGAGGGGRGGGGGGGRGGGGGGGGGGGRAQGDDARLDDLLRARQAGLVRREDLEMALLG